MSLFNRRLPMRRYGVAVLAIVSLFAVVRSQAADGDANAEAVAKDLQVLKGAWRMNSKEVDGRKFSDKEIKDVIGTIDESGGVLVRRGDKVLGEGTVKLDPTKKPKTIDVAFTEGEHKGKTALGIYEIEGDTFRVCLARPGSGDGRPAEFFAKAGSGRILVVYQREKK
jgi:uncharacterized protein (TIGR03067 family)